MNCWYCRACISTDLCQQHLYWDWGEDNISNPSVRSPSINTYLLFLFTGISGSTCTVGYLTHCICDILFELTVSVVNLALLCLSAPCGELKCVRALKCQARLCPFKRGYPDNHFDLILDLQNQVHMMQGFFFFYILPDTPTTSEKKRQILLYIWQTYRSGPVLSLGVQHLFWVEKGQKC